MCDEDNDDDWEYYCRNGEWPKEKKKKHKKHKSSSTGDSDNNAIGGALAGIGSW